jgi:hypothetical protein
MGNDVVRLRTWHVPLKNIEDYLKNESWSHVPEAQS